VATLVFALVVGARGLAPLIGFGLAGFAAGAAIRQLVLATRRQGWRGFVGRANGGMIVHLGVIVLACGLVASSSYIRQAEFELGPGETFALGDTDITYVSAETIVHDNRVEQRANLVVDGKEITTSLEQFVTSGQVVAAPGTRSTISADVQVALLRYPETDDGDVILRATRQPLIAWLWTGGLIMLLGTALSAFPARGSRKPTDPTSAPLPNADPDSAIAATS
jgi:cytochrome c-type biogenesis protein CcmF